MVDRTDQDYQSLKSLKLLPEYFKARLIQNYKNLWLTEGGFKIYATLKEISLAWPSKVKGGKKSQFVPLIPGRWNLLQHLSGVNFALSGFLTEGSHAHKPPWDWPSNREQLQGWKRKVFRLPSSSWECKGVRSPYSTPLEPGFSSKTPHGPRSVSFSSP